jgi:hypothetical protein
MIRSLLVAALIGATASAAVAQGRVGTVTRGSYVCELPGDGDVGPGQPQPNRHFSVETGSRYTTAEGSGTYLRRGELVVMTTGPRRGDKYQVIRPGFLRELGPDSKPGRLRCVREVR